MSRKKQRRPVDGRRADLCLQADRRNHTKQTSRGLHCDTRPDRYPDAPGSKGFDGTSQEAAAAISSQVSFLRRKTLLALHQLGEGVSIEVAKATGHPRETILPRVSELRALGLIEPTGARKLNPSGHSAAIVRLTIRGTALAERFLRKSNAGDIS